MQLSEELPLAETPFVVLDTETTGLTPAFGHRVIEVAAIRLEGWRETGRFTALVNPGRPIDAGATRVHGLVDGDVASAPPFRELVGQLESLLEGAVIVAHNASFDAGFMGQEYAIASRHGVCPPTVANPWLCTLQLARRHFHFGRNDLGTVAYRLGVRQSRAHRALNDANTTAGVFQRMVRELQVRGLRSVGDLLHAQGGAVFMTDATAAPQRTVHPIFVPGTRVRIRYRGGQGDETYRVVEPLYTSDQRGTGYLVAFCHLRGEQRTFRLDRIVSVEPIEKP